MKCTNGERGGGGGDENNEVSASKVALYRVGFWMSEKKSRKFNQIEFDLQCRSHGMDLIQIDLSRPLEDQGEFALILHKLTDVIAKGNAGDEPSKRIIEAFEDYLRTHPDVVMVDPLEQILLLLDRTRTYSMIRGSKLGREDVLCTPSFVELNSTDQTENVGKLKAAGVTFPIICKPTVAHGSRMAHQMALIFNEESLGDVSPPCVAQTFVNHEAVLYKLYVVGDKWECVERPSLKNFYPGDHKTIFFDSHSVSKADSDCLLNKLDVKDQGRQVLRPCTEKLQKIVSTVRETLGMGLFGVDVVVNNQNGRYAIVDINAFPGYDGVPDFPSILTQYMLDQIHKRQKSSSSSPPSTGQETTTTTMTVEREHRSASSSSETNRQQPKSEAVSSSPSLDEIVSALSMDPCQEDSGIDTGDSSDEKKDRKPVVLNRIFRRFNTKGISSPSYSTSNPNPPSNASSLHPV